MHERLELAEKDKLSAVELAKSEAGSEMQKNAAAKDTGPLAQSPAEVKARAEQAVINPSDVFEDTEALTRYFGERKAAGAYNHKTRLIHTNDSVVSGLLTRVFAANRAGLSDPAMKSVGQLLGLNNYNTTRITTAQGMKEMADDLHTLFATLAPTATR